MTDMPPFLRFHPHTRLCAAPLSLLVAGVVLSAAAPAHADPEAAMRMCLRDGKNLVDRSKRVVAESDKNLPKMQGDRLQLEMAQSDLASQDETDKYQERCVKNTDIKKMAEYKQVVAMHKEAHDLFAGAQKRLADALKANTAQAVSAGPGGSMREVEERWRARPDRCDYKNPWARSSGKKSGRVSSEQASSQARDPGELAVARLACGIGIPGIDVLPARKSGFTWHHLQRDLGEALTDPFLPKDVQTVYRGLLAVACYSSIAHPSQANVMLGPEWDLEEDYSTWAVCASETKGVKSAKDVAAAFDRLYPKHDFERENVEYLVKSTQGQVREIDDAFREFGKGHPGLVQIYWDPRQAAKKAYEVRRKKYRTYYTVLDPMTAKLDAKFSNRLPESCWASLHQLRTRLRGELHPSGRDGAIELGAGDPVGYQITEAMVLCSVSAGKIARAARDARLLTRSARQVTAAESVYVAVKRAEFAAEQTGSREALRERMPGFEDGQSLPEMPKSMDLLGGGDLEEQVLTRARLKVVGAASKEPAVVEKLDKIKDGVRVTFAVIKSKVPNHEWACHKTGRIESYEIQANRIVPKYEEACKIVKEHWLTVTYQAPTVVVSPEDAALLAPGLAVELLVNESDSNDAAVVNVYKYAKGKKGDQVAFSGIAF